MAEHRFYNVGYTLDECARAVADLLSEPFPKDEAWPYDIILSLNFTSTRTRLHWNLEVFGGKNAPGLIGGVKSLKWLMALSTMITRNAVKNRNRVKGEMV